MGAGQSDLYSGTYGDNEKSIPSEAVNENVEDWVFKLKSENKNTRNFTDAQKSALNRIQNTIEHNLTEDDFSGVRRDFENTPVPNGKGGYFNHVKEMQQSRVALTKSVKALEGSLQNPFLNGEEKQIMVNSINRANSYIERIDNLFGEYGRGVNK